MVKLLPEQGIKVREKLTYLYDPDWVPEVENIVKEATALSDQIKITAEDAKTVITDTKTTAVEEVTEIKNSAIKTVEETSESAKQDINTTVDEASMRLSDTIEQAVEDVKNEAVAAAEGAIQDAAATATAIVVDYANNEIKPVLNEIAGNAAISATDSQHYAEDSRIWAEGEQSEVQALGGTLSSMGAADLAYAIANAPEDTPIDASGLFAMNVVKGEKGDKGDKGDAGKDGVDGKSVFDGYATNCITEIPQDIKLELNNGTLTLKAGSKVYVPNGKNADGSNKFDEVVIESDITKVAGYGQNNKMLVYVKENSLDVAAVSIVKSGITKPSETNNGFVWYDTANNIIKRYNSSNSTWESLFNSLPVAEVKSTDNVVTTINQVFNGFGYIGSTVFALPGVKGLIPNGRNADGSLKNIEFTTSKVVTQTRTDWSTYNRVFVIEETGVIGTYIKNTASYDDKNNSNVLGGTNRNGCICGEITTVDNIITSFTPKLPFHAVDRNDSSWMSGLGMPSNKYINLTLGASGSTYTAPANGWFYLQMKYIADKFIDMYNRASNTGFIMSSASSGVALRAMTPCKKGDVVDVHYTASSVDSFQFRYAEGDK